MALIKATIPVALRRTVPALSLSSSLAQTVHHSTQTADQCTTPAARTYPITGGKHRRPMTRRPIAPPTTSIKQAHFEIISKAGSHSQTDIELNLHGILDRLRAVLGDVPYGRREDVVSRTPLKVLPPANPLERGSTITFKIFNGDEKQHEQVAKELRALPGVERVEVARS